MEGFYWSGVVWVAEVLKIVMAFRKATCFCEVQIEFSVNNTEQD